VAANPMMTCLLQAPVRGDFRKRRAKSFFMPFREFNHSAAHKHHWPAVPGYPPRPDPRV